MAIQIIGIILIIASSFWLGYRVANRRNEAEKNQLMNNSLALIELLETLSKVFDEGILDVDNNLDGIDENNEKSE